MTGFRLAVTAAGLLVLATQARAACGWFGTQLECDVGRGQLSLGTQRAAEPACSPAFASLSLVQGCEGVADDVVPAGRFRIELQNVGADPGLCRQIGNETYCY